MTSESAEHPVKSGPNVVMLERPGRRTVAGYENALARQELQLQEIRVCAEILLRQRDELMLIQEVLRGLFAFREDATLRVAALTPRQHEIMEMVLDGAPSKLIAWNLGISQRTVENHRAAIMHKTGANGLPELARLALASAWNDVGQSFVQPLPKLALEPSGTAVAVTAVNPQAGGDHPAPQRLGRDRATMRFHELLRREHRAKVCIPLADDR
jgi:DNA-binding CsgD family transcriptional regulator